MKLILKSVKELKQECTNSLSEYTWNYVIKRWRDYDDKKHIFTDVLHHGCASGIVGELVYYVDTVAFYEKYKEDPLGIDVHNQNLLGLDLKKPCVV